MYAHVHVLTGICCITRCLCVLSSLISKLRSLIISTLSYELYTIVWNELWTFNNELPSLAWLLLVHVCVSTMLFLVVLDEEQPHATCTCKCIINEKIPFKLYTCIKDSFRGAEGICLPCTYMYMYINIFQPFGLKCKYQYCAECLYGPWVRWTS